MKRKALVLLSGGLDSILAAKLLKESDISVTGLIFKSCFFNEDKGKQACQQLKIPCQIIDFSKKHLEIVKKPKFGWGSAANPCIDCHLLMLKKAREIMEKKNFSAKGRPAFSWDFVATGEVLGERPLSQNRKALLLISEKSRLKDRLLRPLCAKLLAKTLPEEKGWVKPEFLLAIKGRGRYEQLKLAEKYKLSFPQPAGGCILTEKGFAKKLFDLFEKWPNCQPKDIDLLRIGRHLWSGKAKIILGRDQKENKQLEMMALKEDIIIIPKNFSGPTGLIRNLLKENMNEDLIEKTKKLISDFSSKKEKNLTELNFNICYT